jgi:hypothetical protein
MVLTSFNDPNQVIGLLSPPQDDKPALDGIA